MKVKKTEYGAWEEYRYHLDELKALDAQRAEVLKDMKVVEDNNPGVDLDNPPSPLIYCAIRTPDGTVLSSRSGWDYNDHIDANGEWYMIDGGLFELGRRGSVNVEKAEVIELRLSDSISDIREVARRWNDNIKEYVLLKDMNTQWLMNVITWYGPRSFDASQRVSIYVREARFRNGEDDKVVR